MAKHILTAEDGKKGGKKSKRPPSILRVLNKHLTKHPEDIESIVTTMIQEAKTGTTADRKLLVEYLDGKVTDKVEMTGADGGALETVALDPKKYSSERKKMLKKDDV